VRLPIQIASWIICLGWSTTNLTLSFSQWQNLGHPTESPAGTYKFTDPLAADKVQQFYRVTSP